ncbi:hypothetical protein JKF63_06239 [Porcisia hertigi]|uniref:Uncharacterized protein n=1 Tax=Porcisia hertigi TaxID=2761500 RepID=A0A836ICH1_9TRYP|nr:hypothetical protein JKF63_06239 [Porcisia hertigi]
MWNSLLDQIQQRIDDAVDLLGDDEVEDFEQEDSAHVGLDTTLSLKGSALRQPPLSSSKSLDTGAGVERWEENELSEALLSPTTPEAFLRGPALVGTMPPASPTPLSSSSTHSLSVITSQSKPAALCDGGDVLPFATESPPCLPPSKEAGQQDSSSNVLFDATPSRAGGGLELQDGEASRSLEGLAAPPSLGASSAKSPPLEAVEVQNSSQPQPEGTPAMTTDPSSVLSASERALNAPCYPAPSLPVTAEPSPPPSSTAMARESSDLGQLLRFQEQLAKEMENVTTLQCENAYLKDRVSVLEEELANATASLAQSGEGERHISLLIEKLGRERERRKAVAEERSELKKRVQDLEEELEASRVREESWRSNQERVRGSQIAAQQRIAQLEKDAQICNALVDDLTTQLNEAKHSNGVLENQVEELRVSYATQLDTVKESSSGTADQLRHEVEQLRSSLQNLSNEYTTRVAGLEHEVQSASMRAHHAEVRLSEIEIESVNTLQDLRTELEDYQRCSATWKAEAQKTRNEYTELLDRYASLKRSRAEAEVDLRDRLGSESNTVLALRKGISEWEERYLALQESVSVLQTEIGEQRKVILQLESTIQKMKASSAERLDPPSSEVLLCASTPAEGRAPSSEPPQSALHLSGRLGGRLMSVPPPNPFVSVERSPWSDSTDRRTRERLQQEVVRQSAELERLRVASGEVEAWKEKYNRLQGEHDLLLQLYGQLEESVSVLKKKAAAVVSSAPDSASAAAAS